MEDMNDPERPSGRHAAAAVQAATPPMPRIRPGDRPTTSQYLVADGLSPTIGWQFRLEADGGAAFTIIRRTALGTLKAVESFPLTEDGWTAAWQSFAKQNPAAIPKVLARLRAYEAEAAAEAARFPGEGNPKPYDRLAGITTRTSPETRARILAMFKQGNSKYAKPFDKDRLALASFAGGNWEEYGAIVLQMAILDTLLSIEEKLDRLGGNVQEP